MTIRIYKIQHFNKMNLINKVIPVIKYFYHNGDDMILAIQSEKVEMYEPMSLTPPVNVLQSGNALKINSWNKFKPVLLIFKPEISEDSGYIWIRVNAGTVGNNVS